MTDRPENPQAYCCGKTYNIKHSRKGKFALEVTGQCEEWLHGIITAGTARAIMDYNVRESGEPIVIRKCFITSANEVPAPAMLRAREGK